MKILHTSGHAYVKTLEKLIRLTNPTTIILMHTECAGAFGEISAFAPYRDRVKVLQDIAAWLAQNVSLNLEEQMDYICLAPHRTWMKNGGMLIMNYLCATEKKEVVTRETFHNREEAQIRV